MNKFSRGSSFRVASACSACLSPIISPYVLPCSQIICFLYLSAANLLQSGPYQLYPSGQHFSFIELFCGAFPIQIILWRKSYHFPNSLVYPLFFLHCVCIYIYMNTHIHMHICIFAFFKYAYIPSPRVAAEVCQCFSWNFLQASKSCLCLLLVLR